MNTLYILFALPLLIIFSYLFDAFSRKTKFPSVILLMATGIILRFFLSFSGSNEFAFLDNLIPVLGTIGLILIVLEGALELEISKEKSVLILKGFFAALIILVLNIAALQWVFVQLFQMDTQSSRYLFGTPTPTRSGRWEKPQNGGYTTRWPVSHPTLRSSVATFRSMMGIPPVYCPN